MISQEASSPANRVRVTTRSRKRLVQMSLRVPSKTMIAGEKPCVKYTIPVPSLPEQILVAFGQSDLPPENCTT